VTGGVVDAVESRQWSYRCPSVRCRIDRWTFGREQGGCFESTPSRVGKARVGRTAGVKTL
jgi:hypothetical protein